MTNIFEKINEHIGQTFYSSTYGYVKLQGVSTIPFESLTFVKERNAVADRIAYTSFVVDAFGRADKDGECIIWPSKTDRDWENFKYDPIEIDSYVMASNDGKSWKLMKYAGQHTCYTLPSNRELSISYYYNHIVPFKEFDPENITKYIKEKKS